MENNSTHFIFDGEKVVISPDLHSVVSFLQEIEKEIESFLNFDKKLESIRKQHLETIKFIEVLAGKLKENNIDFKFTFSEHPTSIAEKLKIDRPIRSEMIVLFANLEVLFCLNIAYENKIFDEKEIIKKAMNQDNVKDFLEKFCLNQKNKCVGEKLGWDDDWHIDHKVAFSKGGKTTVANGQLACAQCNLAKSND